MLEKYCLIMLINCSKNIKLVRSVNLCVSPFSKLLGLMFSTKNKIFNSALIFIFKKNMRLDFHMFFVFYSIDIIFLNDLYRVVDFKKNFKPFTLFTAKKPAKFAIEVEKGTISSLNLSRGDVIKWK